MKKTVYNRVLMLNKHSDLDLQTSIQILIQLSADSFDASKSIVQFLKDTALTTLSKKEKFNNLDDCD